MKVTTIHSWARTASLLISLAASIVISPAEAQIEPAAQKLIQASSDTLGAARTLRLTARHTLDPALGVGARIEKGPLQITVKRPNQFFAVQSAGNDTREIAYDGRALCLMHPGLQHHALEPLQAATIEQFADRVDDRFGFRPPVVELLAADMASQLFLHVTAAKSAAVAAATGSTARVVETSRRMK